ncbi:MAG: glycosyl hydrolase family 8 [Bacteroidota bacterium]
MTKKISFLSVLMMLSIMVWGQNFPFPQNVEYPYGIVASNPNTSSIQTKFQAWDQAFYDESGDFGRIKFDEPTQTVSEGIGYGMLIYVYMANNTNSLNQDKFDKLWNYYQNWSSFNGYIMDWKINAFSNSMEEGKSATDGDLDVAYAMLLAHKQWGSSGAVNYIQEAEGLLNAIFTYQVNSQLLLKPGHHWDDAKNPCYFTLASINMFAEAQSQEGFSQTKNWDGVYSTSIQYLENTQSNGLWADWTYDGVDPANNCEMGCDFYWDACRTPWRVAHDYVWNGTAASKTMCDNTIAFLNAKNLLSSPANAGGYSNLTAGSAAQVTDIGDDTQGNSCYVGGLGAALMVDETKQSNLDSYYNYMITRTENPDWGYYAPTIQILYLLTMSGNAPDFYQMNAGPTAPRISGAETNADGTQVILTVNKDVMTPASSETGSFVFKINTITQSSPFTAISLDGTSTIVLDLATSVSIEPGDIMTISYTPGTIESTEGIAMESFSNQAVTNRLEGNSTLVDDCEDMDNTNELGGAWYTYSDADNAGTSIIDPLTSETVDFTMTEGGANGSEYSAEVTYTLGETWGADDNDPFVGIGTQLGEDETPMDISAGTGISFYHKGDACVLEIYLPDNLGETANYDTYAVPVSAHTTWTKVEYAWTDFAQAGWGDVYDLVLTEVYKFQWKISDAPATEGAVAIDYVVLEGLAGESSPTVDKSGLVDAISTAEDKITSAVAGTEPGNYPQTAIDDLQAALDAAQLVAADSEADQATIDQAETDLLDAIDVFNESQIAPDSTLIADCEDENITKLQTYWYSYADGESTIDPLASEADPFVMTTDGADGTVHSASVTGHLAYPEAPASEGDPGYESAGIGFPFTDPEGDYDLTGATGISFYHKGDEVNFSVIISTTEQDAGHDYSYEVPASTTWQLVTVNFPGEGTPEIAQPEWMDAADLTPWDATKITKLQWQVKDGVERDYEFAIDEVSVMGLALDLPEAPEPVDKTALITEITEAQAIIDDAAIGTEPGEYPSASYTEFETAIATAEAVEADDAATQTEVDQAVVDLQDAIDIFEASVNPDLNVDVSALEAAIVDAEAVVNVNVGTLPGEHPVSAQTTLQNAIDDAQDLVDNPTTQDAVNTMVTTLEDAVTTFENTVNPEADKSALTTLISDANTLYSDAVVGTEPGQYPSSAMTTFDAAISDAEAVESDAVATQTEVDQAVVDLQDAIDTFEASVIPEVLENTLIADCENENITKLQTYWYSYADGESTIDPLASEADPFVMTTDGADGTVHSASVTGHLAYPEAPASEGDPGYESAGIGFPFTDPEGDYDLTGATGISFYHKGDEVNFSVIISTTEQDAGHDYSYEVPASTTWQLVTVNFPGEGTPEIAQPEWMDAADLTPWDATKITKLQWQVKDGVERDYEFAIDEVSVMGLALDLPEAPEPVDKTALITEITEVQTIIDNAVIGTEPGQYPLSAGMALENAKSAAQDVADNEAATQTEVDQAVIDLQDAIDTFEASVISEPNVDVTSLEAKITEATNTLSIADIGVNEGQHPQSAADDLQAAIDDAQSLVNNPTTQADVDAMVTTLDDAIITFENTTNPSVGVDKDALESIISSAESAYSNAVEGSADGEYEVGSKADLQTAIDAAQIVFDDGTATQTEVNQALSDMETALDVFQSRLIGVDKSTLQSLVSSAQSLLNEATPGTTVGTYPQTSIDDFEYAIDSVQIILINSGYTQAEVDQAVIDLQDAIDVFEASVNPVTVSKDELQTVISEARAIYESAVVGSEPGQYPLQETHVFISEIESAEELYADDAAIQAQVNQMVSDLEDAIATFEAAQVPGDPATDIDSVVSVDLAVYPNPCSSFVSVSSSELMSRVSIVSIKGTVVKEIDANDTNIIIDVNDLSQGVYFIHIEFDSVQQESIQIYKK